MKRDFPSSWFLKQSSPAGTVGNGDISGFDLNKEGFGGCSGKVLVLSLGTLCLWCGLGKLLHSQSQDKIKLPIVTGLSCFSCDRSSGGRNVAQV